ncbi:uncharacterized protein UHOD_01257 [Ustilago sp. UG-2017b]|nr:uncharacterized protein UHOD_01257 [Ustilago sp. UG-2017b]
MLFANAQYLRYQWYTTWTAIEGSAVIWRQDLHNKKQTNDANDSPSSQPNVHIDPKSKDDRFKLQIRGSMLVALMVAAWERRSEALASSDKNRLAPSEPIIVTAMRFMAAGSHLQQPAHPYAPLHPIQRDISNRPAVLSHTDMPRQQDFQSRDVHSSGQQYQTSQQAHANVDFNEDLAKFLDPVLGATSSTYDDMLSLNSLLQSSVGLDSTSWLGSTLGPTPEDGVEIKGPSSLTEFLPSL